MNALDSRFQNKFYFRVADAIQRGNYVVADLIFSKLNSGRLIKIFHSYEDARDFWNNNYNKYIALHIVNNCKIIN